MLLLVTMTKLWNIDMWNVSTENSSIYFRIQILISQMMFPRFHASCKTKLLASYVQIHVKISSKLWTFIVWKTVEFEALDHCYFVSEQEMFGLSCRGGQKVGVQKSPRGMCVFLMWWSLIQRELHQQISSNGIEILLCLSRLKLSNQHKILHMAQQLCCCLMCKILCWLYGCELNSNIISLKFDLLSKYSQWNGRKDFKVHWDGYMLSQPCMTPVSCWSCFIDFRGGQPQTQQLESSFTT